MTGEYFNQSDCRRPFQGVTIKTVTERCIKRTRQRFGKETLLVQGNVSKGNKNAKTVGMNYLMIVVSSRPLSVCAC